MSSAPAQEALADRAALLRSEVSECQYEKSDLMGQAPLGRACGFALVRCNVPKVTQMVNGKAISNKPSVFCFSGPLASL